MSTQKENSHCPRCGRNFVCNPGNIQACQCSGIPLSAEQKAFIEERYQGQCLCKDCLLELGNKAELFMEKYFYGKERK
jgi:Cysteine-rich CWC